MIVLSQGSARVPCRRRSAARSQGGREPRQEILDAGFLDLPHIGSFPAEVSPSLRLLQWDFRV